MQTQRDLAARARKYGLVRLLRALEFCNRHSRTRSQGFFDSAQFPWVGNLERGWPAVRGELDRLLPAVDRIPNFQDLQEKQADLTRDDRWKVFPFWAYGIPYEPNCRKCPRTAELLQLIPGMTSAMFSILRGPKSIPPHRGPYNGVLRYHLALRVPGELHKAWIRVGEERRSWQEGASLVFDDTFEHEVYDGNPGERVVLFVDFLRPTGKVLEALNRHMVAVIARSPYIQDALRNLERWEDAQQTRPDEHAS